MNHQEYTRLVALLDLQKDLRFVDYRRLELKNFDALVKEVEIELKKLTFNPEKKRCE